MANPPNSSIPFRSFRAIANPIPLESPRSGGAPLAIPDYTGVPVSGGLGRMQVFAVAQNGSQDFELFTQIHDGNNRSSGWTRHGAPRELGGEKFN